MIPPFAKTGTLPQGEWECTVQELGVHFGFNAKRKKLLLGLKRIIRVLKKSGCSTIWVDGSFVTEKESPNDIDLLYDEAGLDWDVLSQLEPVLLDMSRSRAAQKAKFGCEAFSASWIATIHGEPFLSFFQHDRAGEPKGIVRLNLKSKKGRVK
jgi:hypothetical protein